MYSAAGFLVGLLLDQQNQACTTMQRRHTELTQASGCGEKNVETVFRLIINSQNRLPRCQCIDRREKHNDVALRLVGVFPPSSPLTQSS